jgi:hypothetical protein
MLLIYRKTSYINGISLETQLYELLEILNKQLTIQLLSSN